MVINNERHKTSFLKLLLRAFSPMLGKRPSREEEEGAAEDKASCENPGEASFRKLERKTEQQTFEIFRTKWKAMVAAEKQFRQQMNMLHGFDFPIDDSSIIRDFQRRRPSVMDDVLLYFKFPTDFCIT